MDSKLLRLASPIIAQVIAHIFNLSLALGTLPADWKLAIVTPIYKNIGPRDNLSNYRPISVVFNVTKLIEKHVKGQLLEFLLKNNLLCHEHAYLKNHSTTTALHSLTEHWLDYINNTEINGLCQLDLSKGFDTVNVEILLYKLAKYGFSDQSLFWFKSYFTDHSQVVSCNGKLSKPNSLSMGIPQVTVHGPLFYLLYTNDLSSNIKSGTIVAYADDSSIIAHGQNMEQLQHNLQLSLNQATDWFNSNRLVVNASKSSTMIITTPDNITNICKPLALKINYATLEHNTSSKPLGIMIDQTLKWDTHVKYICKKINPKIGLIHRLRKILPIKVLSTLYLTLIQPHIDYCISVWGACAL